MATSQVSLREIDKHSPIYILSSLPQSHPRCPTWIFTLASRQLQRYKLSTDKRDLDASILHFAHAILLPFDFSIEGGTLRIMAFFDLTLALCYRSDKHKQPSDIETIIKYLRYRRDHSLEMTGAGRHDITVSLVRALRLQVMSGFGDALANLAEMTVLCHELLASDVLEGPLTDAVIYLVAVLYSVEGEVLRDQPLEKVIMCLRDANARLPGLHFASQGLAYSLFRRFQVTRSSGDYEEAMAKLDKITASYSSSGHPDTHTYGALYWAAILAEVRFSCSASPEYLEEAIFRVRAFLRFLSPEDPNYPIYNQSLARLEGRRYNEFGVTNGLPESHSRDSGVIDPHSSLATSNALKPLPTKRADMIKHLEMLRQLTDLADIKEAIKYCRLALASLRSTDKIALTTAMMLDDFLFHVFRYTDNAEHLNASIAVLRHALKMPAAQWDQLFIVKDLIFRLYSRFLLSNDSKDLNEIMQLFPIAAADKNATVPKRSEVSFYWVLFAVVFEHPSLRTAYDSAISLVQDSLVFAPTLETQHFRLASMRDGHKMLPLHYASYQIQIGQLKRAIETLEQGRGLLWSEMRGLRTSIGRIRLIDMRLADKFAALNRDLEALTTSGPPRVRRSDDEVEGSEGMDPFGRLVVEQRKLVEERDKLILQIRTLPGFERFLMAPSFDTLRLAAASGPVIIINHFELRSDILILFHNSPPCLIPTANDFYRRTNGLKNQLSVARKEGLGSKAYEDALRSVLETLYELVGRPVIQVLHKSNVPEQSRVWWCPTSAFCSLPLHAMGPLSSDDGTKRSISPTCISPHTPQHSLRSSSLVNLVHRHSFNLRCFWSHSQMSLFPM